VIDRALQTRAGVLVMLAKRRGELVAPDRCSSCTRETKVLAHHEDYARPLDVTWLCSACHMRRHGELGWGLPHSNRRRAAAHDETFPRELTQQESAS
jgi:hypothetical protein